MSGEWRLRDGPRLLRQDTDGSITDTTPVSFQPGDFVEVNAYLDLISFRDLDLQCDVVEVCLAMNSVIRLYSVEQIKVRSAGQLTVIAFYSSRAASTGTSHHTRSQ